MIARLSLAFAVLVALAAPASAHRLDEYLHATTISFQSPAQVGIRLRLTPGVAVAPEIVAAIDSNHDGTLSAGEQRRYVDEVRQQLDLHIDGAAVPLRLEGWTFPLPGQLREGVGDIILTLSAPLPEGTSHSLVYRDRHAPAIAVYLVNTLTPRDPGITVVNQQRSFDQSRYRLDFVIGAVTKANGGRDTGTAAAIVGPYFLHGVRHILTGYDHLLFVAALVLGAATLWDLVKVVTAFTVAHSITLALAAMKLVYLPPAIVEPMIAASIVAVALQNVFWPDRSHGSSRLAIAFVFGLFHGLGFAGGLLEIMHRMPINDILLAILGFSLGVETGNQIVLLPLFALTRFLADRVPSSARWKEDFPPARNLGSLLIGTGGIYYLLTAIFPGIG